MSLLVQAADYLGNYALSSIVYFKFSVTDATGVLTTLGGTPAVKVYKDNGTTESTAGITLTVDFDSRTGLCQVAIDTSSDGTFYAGGHDFEAVLTAGTVGLVSVAGTPVGHFSLLNRVDTLADGVAHGGTPGSSTATLALKQLNVTNPGAAQAVHIESVGGGLGMQILSTNATALDIEDLAGGTGVSIQGGANANGLYIYGGAAVQLQGVLGGGQSGAGLEILAAGAISSTLPGGAPAVSIRGDQCAIYADALSGHALQLVAATLGKHDIALTGSGDILGNLTGTTGGLTAGGLDAILIDGKTLPVALQIIAAVVAGKVSGAGTTTETFLGLDGITVRAVETVDASGNRTGADYS